MKRLAIAGLIGGSICSPVYATMLLTGVGSNSYTAPPAVAFSQDFLTTSSLDGHFTFSRADSAQVATYVDSSGLVQLVASNGAARFDYDFTSVGTALGLLLEEERINYAKYNRNMTLTWGVSNFTRAKDQTGVDGVANSASSITSSTANGSLTQTVTLAAANRVGTVYAKRISGANNLKITNNNGSTALTTATTGSWVRYRQPATYESVTNSAFGFYNVTAAANSWAVDYFQEEVGTYPTSPIYNSGNTTNTRHADVLGADSTLAYWMSVGYTMEQWKDEATGTVTRTSYAPGTYAFHTGGWLQLFCVYDSLKDATFVNAARDAGNGTDCEGN
jgi:hypothetical protein